MLDTDAGGFHVIGSPTPTLTWRDLASRRGAARDASTSCGQRRYSRQALRRSRSGLTSRSSRSTPKRAAVELRRLVAVDDAGRIINPVIAEGQVHGGVATGVAQALYEEFVYDEDGNPLTANFLGYAFPSAAELPSFDTVEMETPTPINALGAKGIGESGTIGATPAVQSAVIDALAPFGVRHVDMPANGERVWRALQEARG